MPGSTLQLLVSGEMDKVLIGNPDVTFYKSVFKRFANFSMENIKFDLVGETTELKYRDEIKLKTSIPKTGDLLNKLYFSRMFIAIFNFDSSFVI